MQLAFALTQSTQLSPFYQVFFDWSDDELTFWNTFMNSAMTCGLILGSVFGSMIIASGRRHSLLLVQTVAIFATILCMFKNLAMILIGRFLQGAVAVTVSLIMGKSISETVPEKMAGQYGMLTNIFINLGCLISYTSGMLLSEDKETYETDESWKLVTAIPALVGFLSIMITLIFFPEEPVGWCLANERMEEAQRSILNVYTIKKTNRGKASDEEILKKSSEALFDDLIVMRRTTTSIG